MYNFNHIEIMQHPLHQIEYSIIDVYNKNCRSCSHFAPLAKQANKISIEEFVENTKILHSIISDVHTFWLIGGEPTMHPQYLEILRELRRIYRDIPIGVMSNGYGILQKKYDENFWNFIKENQIVGRITTYGVKPSLYRELFMKNGCADLLSLDVNNRFTNLALLAEEEKEISFINYVRCGWERINIFVRNGKIWKCPAVEYVDLFNDYFGKSFQVADDDYLDITSGLTRKAIHEFKNRPVSFCKHCDISKRFKNVFEVEPPERKITEWMVV